MYAQMCNFVLAQPGHLSWDTELNSISMHGRKEEGRGGWKGGGGGRWRSGRDVGGMEGRKGKGRVTNMQN